MERNGKSDEKKESKAQNHEQKTKAFMNEKNTNQLIGENS